MLLHKKQCESGLTLIEVVVALSILMVVLTTTMTLMLGNASSNRRTSDRSTASRVLEQTFERYRQRSDYDVLSTSGPITESSVIDGKTYTTVTTFCSPSRGADIIAKMPCSNAAVYLDVEVKQNNLVLDKGSSYFTKFGAVNE